MMEDDARVMTRMLREQGVDERAQRSHSRKRGAPASAEAGAKRAAPAVAIMTNKEVQAGIEVLVSNEKTVGEILSTVRTGQLRRLSADEIVAGRGRGHGRHG